MKKTNTLYKQDPAVNLILDTAYSFQKSVVFLSAFKLKIFTALSDKERTADDIAAELNTHPKATERLLNALVMLGFIVKEADLYSNKKFTRDYLDANSSYYINGLGHVSNLSKIWATLPEVIKTGLPVKYDDQRSEQETLDFINAMHWRAHSQASDIINSLDFRGVNKFLDLACGSAAYSLEVARKYPNIQIAVFDLPNVIPITNRYLEREGMYDKFVTLSGDYLKDDIGKGYDMVFLSAVLHSNTIWENIELVRKVYDSLNPGGRIVIQEFLINEDRVSPDYSVFFSLNMLVNTPGGDTLTETEIWIILKEAWFDNIVKIETEFNTTIMTGKKV